MSDTKIKLANTLVIVTTLLFSANVFANVGKVVYGYGNNYALDTDGNRRTLKKGAQIREGDTLVTKRGRMHVRLIDGGYVSVYPNSEYKINKFKYTGKAYNNTPAKTEKQSVAEKEDTGLFSLIRGAARQVTGMLGRTYNKKFKFKTNVATIGIRGTGFFARICQADCYDADGNIMQDGMYVKNNTGIITMSTNAGDVALAQGQSAFAASSEDTPQQLLQPPIAYNVVTPDTELFDFDEKAIDKGVVGAIDLIPVDTGAVTPPAVVITKLDAATNLDTNVSEILAGVDATAITDSIVQSGDSIEQFQFTDAVGTVITFDKSTATLVESGSDASLGIVWNRWQGSSTFKIDGISAPLLDGQIHLIGSDGYTAAMPSAARGTVQYSSVGGTKPSIAGIAGNQTGTQSVTAMISYDTAKLSSFQLNANFTDASIIANSSGTDILSATSGNIIALTGSCTGALCDSATAVTYSGDASLNLVGANAEGIYGAYNLANGSNTVSGSYVAKDTSVAPAF